MACGDNLPETGLCDTDPIADTSPVSTAASRVGFVQIRDTWDRTWDDFGVPRDVRTGRLQAGFVDRSTVTSTPAAVMPLSEVCFGLISRPVRTGSALPLAVTEVQVQDTSRGTIVASPAGPGTYIAVGEPILGEGQGDLRFVVNSTSTPGFGLDQPLPSLSSDTGWTQPDPNLPQTLEPGQLPLRWTAGGADWIELTITPKSDGVDDGGQVICRVADTGCFDVPGSVTAFLLAGNAPHYTMTLQSYRYRALETSTDHFVELEVISETRLTLDNEGLQ